MRDDESKRMDYSRFYNALPGILPCGVCGRHLKEHLESMPIEAALDTRQSLFRWTVDLHNAVNRHTGRTPEMTVDEAFAFWKGVCIGEQGVGIGGTKDKDKHQQNNANAWKTLAIVAGGIVASLIIIRVFFPSVTKRSMR